MILSFSKERFVHDIKTFRKIHTIRADFHERWKRDRKINFWFRNPRMKGRTKDGIDPYEFHVGHRRDRCKWVDTISIMNMSHKDDPFKPSPMGGLVIKLNGKWLEEDSNLTRLIARNDIPSGDFPDENEIESVTMFRMWFVPKADDFFSGKIVHWVLPNGYNNLDDFGDVECLRCCKVVFDWRRKENFMCDRCTDALLSEVQQDKMPFPRALDSNNYPPSQFGD